MRTFLRAFLLAAMVAMASAPAGSQGTPVPQFFKCDHTWGNCTLRATCICGSMTTWLQTICEVNGGYVVSNLGPGSALQWCTCNNCDGGFPEEK